MPKLTSYLIDANLWLALSAARHEHHPRASTWFQTLGEGQAILCRVAEMGLLRLVTNPSVMKEDTLDCLQGWAMGRKLRSDHRVIFRNEPSELEEHWHRLMREHPAGHHTWTDAYLAAFAQGHGATLATFDRAFLKWKVPDVLLVS
jgi:toxin-antitoxin system PIN domain toxin